MKLLDYIKTTEHRSAQMKHGWILKKEKLKKSESDTLLSDSRDSVF